MSESKNLEVVEVCQDKVKEYTGGVLGYIHKKFELNLQEEEAEET